MQFFTSQKLSCLNNNKTLEVNFWSAEEEMAEAHTGL